MTRRNTSIALAVLAVVAIAAAGLGNLLSFAAPTTVSSLAQESHFHGIAVDPSEPSRVYLATHNGLYVVAPDGSAEAVSKSSDDFMGFTAHPTESTILYASGHPTSGGSMGFIASTDGGRTWSKLSDGIGGPVDFHQMDVSKADPAVVYGVQGGVQRSGDGGRTWMMTGPAPEGLISLAASSKNADALYAATQGGLLRSSDAGRSWQLAHIIKRPATMVHVARQGDVYAFIVGTGLVRAADGDVNWQPVNTAFGDDVLLHMAADPTDSNKLYAIAVNTKTRVQSVLASSDGGKTWVALGG